MTHEERDDEEVLRELESNFRESPGNASGLGALAESCRLSPERLRRFFVPFHKREEALRLLDDVLYEVACIRGAADQVCDSIDLVMDLLHEEQADE